MENLLNNKQPVSDFRDSNSGKFFSLPTFIIFIIIAAVIGIGIGYLVPSIIQGNKGTTTGSSSTKSAGVIDKKTFKDKAEGILKQGGIDGEGNFHLERPGGESQNVYLTSTTVDLSPFVGKKVRVWGETFTGEKAGWLMDVGSVETL